MKRLAVQTSADAASSSRWPACKRSKVPPTATRSQASAPSGWSPRMQGCACASLATPCPSACASNACPGGAVHVHQHTAKLVLFAALQASCDRVAAACCYPSCVCYVQTCMKQILFWLSLKFLQPPSPRCVEQGATTYMPAHQPGGLAGLSYPAPLSAGAEALRRAGRSRRPPAPALGDACSLLSAPSPAPVCAQCALHIKQLSHLLVC